MTQPATTSTDTPVSPLVKPAREPDFVVAVAVWGTEEIAVIKSQRNTVDLLDSDYITTTKNSPIYLANGIGTVVQQAVCDSIDKLWPDVRSDINQDGIVDLGDMDAWRAQVGKADPSITGKLQEPNTGA